jgi:hypothetical protein
MKKLLILFFVFFLNLTFSQRNNTLQNNGSPNEKEKSPFSAKKKEEKPPISLYKIYTLEKDTTFVDTTLSIAKEYKYNLLRKDIFGLIAFANEGHTYNTLDFGLIRKKVNPVMGFSGKHFNYLEVEDIKYYNVPTPLSDLYFKTVMEQGQSVDAFLTVNTKPNLNFSIAYKGIRSIGKYINNISSSGNFRFTTSYFTTDKRYHLNAHFTGQDISNQENGGIKDINLFELSEQPYNQRERLDVYFNDATSLLKGNRFLIDHSYKLSKDNSNSFVILHQFNHEYKFFNFEQITSNERFGNSLSGTINNKTRYNHLYNKLGLGFTTDKYGDISVFIDDNNYNYFYKSVVYDNVGNISVPNAINDRITSVGGNVDYKINKFNLKLLASNSITKQSISNIQASLDYKLNNDLKIQFEYQKINSLPNLNYTLYQSSYIDYNWFNNFKNEKTNQFQVSALSKWVKLEAKYAILDDYLYFDNELNDITKLNVKPFQLDKTITYASVKASNEIKFWKLALDNTFLYQNVENSDKKLNVPQFVTRNSLYFSEHVFKKAMFIQTGIIFNYFTEYYANDYNPLLGEFYTQSERKIGGFPMIDFFINAKVKQARLFLKAEHFNSSMTGYNFYSAPNYPYRDFIVRFGIVWNFFK